MNDYIKLHPHTAQEPCPGGCKDIDKVTEVIDETKQELARFEQRLKESHDQQNRLEGRMTEGDARMGRIEQTINANSSSMTQNTHDTAEILQIMRETKTAFKMIARLGMAIRWFAGIGVALGSVWLVFRDINK